MLATVTAAQLTERSVHLRHLAEDVILSQLATYQHVQLTPAATWIVNHNLGRKIVPVIITVDNAGEDVAADIEYTNTNTLRIYFCAPVTGTANI